MVAVLEEAYRQIGLTEQQSAIPKNLQTLMDVLAMKFKMIEEDCKADYMQTFFQMKMQINCIQGRSQNTKERNARMVTGWP